MFKKIYFMKMWKTFLFMEHMNLTYALFLKPHIMKVGGSSDWHQNSIDDSPTLGNIKSRRIFHPTLNQLTLWSLES